MADTDATPAPPTEESYSKDYVETLKKQLEESVELRALLSGEVTDKGLLIKSKETELREMREELRSATPQPIRLLRYVNPMFSDVVASAV